MPHGLLETGVSASVPAPLSAATGDFPVLVFIVLNRTSKSTNGGRGGVGERWP